MYLTTYTNTDYIFYGVVEFSFKVIGYPLTLVAAPVCGVRIELGRPMATIVLVRMAKYLHALQLHPRGDYLYGRLA